MSAFAPFVARHIGPSPADQEKMLKLLGFSSLDAFIDEVVPSDIRRKDGMAKLPAPLNEADALAALRKLADKNKVFRSLIGQGYYGTIVPPVILRNVLENPGWYTSYTPYQPEISQGRLEALLNFQTMVCDLTAMDIANASLLDEATAGIDPENEKFILEAIDELVKNKTLIVIAHRLSTIQKADNIVYLEDGEIKEMGNHDELLEKNGRYKKQFDFYTKMKE